MSQKTQVIAGHEITLTTGVRYYASRPMAQQKGELFTVSIRQNFGDKSIIEIPNLTYDQANEFITEFNSGSIFFEERVW